MPFHAWLRDGKRGSSAAVRHSKHRASLDYKKMSAARKRVARGGAAPETFAPFCFPAGKAPLVAARRCGRIPNDLGARSSGDRASVFLM